MDSMDLVDIRLREIDQVHACSVEEEEEEEEEGTT
jgi:hypothetical protein